LIPSKGSFGSLSPSKRSVIFIIPLFSNFEAIET